MLTTKNKSNRVARHKRIKPKTAPGSVMMMVKFNVHTLRCEGIVRISKFSSLRRVFMKFHGSGTTDDIIISVTNIAPLELDLAPFEGSLAP